MWINFFFYKFAIVFKTHQIDMTKEQLHYDCGIVNIEIPEHKDSNVFHWKFLLAIEKTQQLYI